MKCPNIYNVMQSIYKKPIISEEHVLKAEINVMVEHGSFGECYKEECMAYDKENGTCRKVWNNE